MKWRRSINNIVANDGIWCNSVICLHPACISILSSLNFSIFIHQQRNHTKKFNSSMHRFFFFLFPNFSIWFRIICSFFRLLTDFSSTRNTISHIWKSFSLFKVNSFYPSSSGFAIFFYFWWFSMVFFPSFSFSFFNFPITISTSITNFLLQRDSS